MASAGARFESARASGDRAAARAAVEDIVSDAKDPAKRAALASSGAAVSIAAELLRAARAACWCDAADATEAADAFLVPFAPLARALRTVCAGNAVARGGACALPRRDAPEAKNGTEGAKTCIISHAAPQASSNIQWVHVRGLGSSRGLHP